MERSRSHAFGDQLEVGGYSVGQPAEDVERACDCSRDEIQFFEAFGLFAGKSAPCDYRVGVSGERQGGVGLQGLYGLHQFRRWHNVPVNDDVVGIGAEFGRKYGVEIVDGKIGVMSGQQGLPTEACGEQSGLQVGYRAGVSEREQ